MIAGDTFENGAAIDAESEAGRAQEFHLTGGFPIEQHRIVPEEVYVISHHVHHAFPEKPGDPYNALRGRLYCFFAGELHQPISRSLTPDDYARLVGMMIF